MLPGDELHGPKPGMGPSAWLGPLEARAQETGFWVSWLWQARKPSGNTERRPSGRPAPWREHEMPGVAGGCRTAISTGSGCA